MRCLLSSSQENSMNKSEIYLKGGFKWCAPLLIAALATGCGGGGGGRDPILGANVASVILVPPVGAIAPGNCSVTGPKVTVTDPTDGSSTETTSTAGVANNGKLVTATFSEAMNAATINATTFKLAPTGGVALVPVSVSYNAATNVATLTTSSALSTNTAYTAVIQGQVTNGANAPIGCSYVWSFKTAVAAAAGSPSVNLGLAAPFAIAATAGVTNTLTVPNTRINGNAVLNPNATCNAVTVDNVGGFGLCGGASPTISGKVITPTYPDTTTAKAVQADLRAAFLSITPPAGPPAAGSLGGGTPIAAPTGMGAVTGSALVAGQNLFFPGVYNSGTSILVGNDLTLDAQGNPNARFVFQSASTVGSAAGAASPGTHTRILLVNGAKASNVWWQAGTSATLGTNSDWQGNILAAASVTMNTGATSCGRLLAGAFTAGAFVFDSNVVSVPGNPSGPATCQ
jgi:hypothetical protein